MWGGGLAFLRAKFSEFANLPQSVVKLGFSKLKMGTKLVD